MDVVRCVISNVCVLNACMCFAINSVCMYTLILSVVKDSDDDVKQYVV